MQGNQKKINQQEELVRKPYLKGKANSPLCARRGLRVLVYQIALVFIFLFIGQVLLTQSVPLRIALNLLVVFGFFMLMYSEGSRAGLDDVAFSEIALGRQQNGKQIEKKELERCYHPAKGLWTVLYGMLPLLLLALAFAFLTREQKYVLGGLPSWVSAYERRADIGLALGYYHEAQSIGLEAILRIIIRLLLFPYINMAGTDSSSLLLLLERLSPLLILIIPMGYAFGYLRGPVLRARVHGAIKADTKRRIRREKKARLLRREPKKLV